MKQFCYNDVDHIVFQHKLNSIPSVKSSFNPDKFKVGALLLRYKTPV